LQQSHTEPGVLILKMNEVISMDARAAQTRASVWQTVQVRQASHPVRSAHATVFLMHQAGLFEAAGKENVASTLDDALQRTREFLKQK